MTAKRSKQNVHILEIPDFNKMGFEEDFCGSKFWDENVTWNTNDPDFTPCFHKTVLAWAPTVILAFFTFNDVNQFKKSDNRDIPWNFLTLSKTLITGLLILLSITELILNGVYDAKDDILVEVYPVDYVTNVIFLLTFSW